MQDWQGSKPLPSSIFVSVSTLILSLLQTCVVVKSVQWCPHHGVRITVNIDFDAVVSRHLIGALSKRRSRNTEEPHARQGFEHSKGANPALWDEERRRCVFDGNRLRSEDGQGDAKMACT